MTSETNLWPPKVDEQPPETYGQEPMVLLLEKFPSNFREMANGSLRLTATLKTINLHLARWVHMQPACQELMARFLPCNPHATSRILNDHPPICMKFQTKENCPLTRIYYAR